MRRRKIVKELAEKVSKLLDIPRIEDMERILVVSPHPDDAEIGLGATTYKLSREGSRITYLIATDGRLGALDPNLGPEEIAQIRREEQKRSAEFLGVERLIWLNFPDLGDYTVDELREKLLYHIREMNPDLVFAPDPYLPYEAHPDHKKVGLATLEAVFLGGVSRFREETWKGEFKSSAIAFYFTAFPNTFVCVNSHMDRKLEALRMHKSQFSGEIQELLENYLLERARFFGDMSGCRYAEDFKLLPRIALHVFPEAFWL